MSWSFSPPPVEDLWRYWGPRFLAAGVDPIILGHLQEEVDHWGKWYEGWTKYADETEQWAERALESGHRLTAGEHFARASTLHHFAGMVKIDEMDIYDAAERKRVETYAKGAPHFAVPAEPIEIPFQGTKMPGYLRVPPSDGPVPLVVFVNGWEGCKESSANTDSLLARGLATFTMDGPGIGETLHVLPLTGEYGPPIAATLDVLEQREEIDAGRMALHGGSRGGLLATRAAAFDERVVALATVGPGYETRRLTWADGMSELVDAFMQHLFHVDSVDAANERVSRPDFSLEGVTEHVRCPTLIVTDNSAGQRFEGSQRLYEELPGPKDMVIVPGAQRNGARRIYIVRPLVADWLADRLGTIN